MSPTPRARVILVDDHPVVREGLAHLLERQAGVDVVRQCDTAREVLSTVESNDIDLAIVDIRLGDEDGLDLIKSLRARWPEMHLLALSMHDEKLYARRALRAGADGYVMKSEDPQVLLRAVERVLEGKRFVSDAVQDELLREMSGGGAAPESLVHTLADRELAVFELLGHGKGTREIAESLNLSVKTVQTYRERIKAKLGIQNAAALVRRAVIWVHGSDGAEGAERNED